MQRQWTFVHLLTRINSNLLWRSVEHDERREGRTGRREDRTAISTYAQAAWTPPGDPQRVSMGSARIMTMTMNTRPAYHTVGERQETRWQRIPRSVPSRSAKLRGSLTCVEHPGLRVRTGSVFPNRNVAIEVGSGFRTPLKTDFKLTWGQWHIDVRCVTRHAWWHGQESQCETQQCAVAWSLDAKTRHSHNAKTRQIVSRTRPWSHVPSPLGTWSSE